jgi:hypothetical protein
MVRQEFWDGPVAVSAVAAEVVSTGMSTQRSTPPASQQVWRDAQRRRRKRRAMMSLVVTGAAIVVVAAVAIWATSRSSSAPATTPNGTVASPASPLPVTAPPQQVIIAKAPLVTIALPVNQSAVTALAFRSIPDPSAVELTPTGPIHEYDEGASGNALPDLELDVGAPAGTLVYSPVDGRIIGDYPNIVAGQVLGYRILIAPQGATNVAVSVAHLQTHAGSSAPTVGQSVIAGVTPLGQVIDLSTVASQDISQFSGDAGNHVAIEVVRTATSS